MQCSHRSATSCMGSSIYHFNYYQTDLFGEKPLMNQLWDKEKQSLSLRDGSDLNQTAFDKNFGLQDIPNSTNKKNIRMPAPKKKLSNIVKSFIPILNWLPKYDIKQNLLNDVIGGLTVGIMHVPQGMAYSSLAGVKPINGLYTSLFPGLFYMLFGTSPHVSLGVFAVVSLMVGSCNLRVTEQLMNVRNITLDEFSDVDLTSQVSTEVITSLTLLVGLVQIVMVILRMDSMASLLSDQVITGFTTGAAFHVFVAQLNKIIGVKLPRESGFGKLFRSIISLYNSLTGVNYVTLGISLVFIVILFSLKEYLNPIIKKKLKLPIPWELILMVIGIILSRVLDLNGNYQVITIGSIKTGIPIPSFPNVRIFSYFIQDAVAIAIVVVVVTISMGKLFSKKHAYSIDVKQEFYALGFMECLSSFFPVWPSSTALARTLVYEAAGTKTQLATVFSASLLLSVIFWLGPFMSVLPTCFLSCIIIVALKGMFMQMTIIPYLWRVNKSDCVIFLVTMLSTICMDVVEGLASGVIFAVAVLVYKMQASHMIELGELRENELRDYYRPLSEYSTAYRHPEICILKFLTNLVFLNVDQFKTELEQYSSSSGVIATTKSIVESKKEKKLAVDVMLSTPVKLIVVDLSTTTYLDHAGALCIIESVQDMKKKKISLVYTGLCNSVYHMITLVDKFKNADIAGHFYPSIQDAVGTYKGSMYEDNIESVE